MIHLRPQRVYKPSTSSGNPNNSIANYLDRYYNQGLYRLRLETPRGTSLTEDNSQITCYAHVFNNTDGSEVTDRLKGRGFRPTWLLDGKSIDSVCISEEGYLLTLDSAHLTDYTQTVTLQALDTEILSALSEEPQFDLWLQQTLKGQGIQPTLLKQSETLINFALVNKKLKVGGRNLLLNSDKPLSNKEYNVGRYHISDPSLMVAGEYYTIQIWAAIEGADFSESIWVYNSGGNTEVANIQKLDNGVWQETFKWRDDSDKSNSYLNLFRGANHPNNKNSYNTTIKRIKLERGTVATDWTPAPEDLDDSISKVSTDLTLLERSLLDNDTGEINKLKKLLGNHGKHFEELATHPLTVDEAGYWKIWSVKDSKYLTTHYPSRGEAGHSPSPEDVLVTTRFAELLGGEVTKQITPISQDLEETTRIAREGVDAANYSLQELDKARRDIDGEIAQAKTDLGRDINNLYSVTNGMTGDLEALDTGVSNALDKADMAERAAVDVSGRLDSFKTSANTNITNANTYIDNAFTYIGDIVHTLDSSRRYSISSSGRVSSHVSKTCSTVQKDLPSSWRSLCQPPPVEPEIRLVLYSDYESLRAQVMTLTSKLAQLEATTTVTPVTNAYNRAKEGHFGQVTDSLYPLYGDWLLTSDAKEQKIYFSGLRAEIGRSIYIQTRKKAYLNANGHSFYGLPSVSENQWLSNNTTYRFVRASDTAWLVTASSSPYPWT